MSFKCLWMSQMHCGIDRSVLRKPWHFEELIFIVWPLFAYESHTHLSVQAVWNTITHGDYCIAPKNSLQKSRKPFHCSRTFRFVPFIHMSPARLCLNLINCVFKKYVWKPKHNSRCLSINTVRFSQIMWNIHLLLHCLWKLFILEVILTIYNASQKIVTYI